MALSVHQAIETKDHLIIEAGVGIGKSFAYLIPLMLYFKYTKKSFIVSTSTIALQEQLENDIKILAKQLQVDIEIVVAKGKSNFLCLNRLEKFLVQADNSSKYKSYFNICKQDRKEYPNIKDAIWKQINVDNCSYGKCKNCATCEFYHRRNLMKKINGVIICNHDLLIEDISRFSSLVDWNLLKKVDYIVCDEAHNLESKVRASRTK